MDEAGASRYHGRRPQGRHSGPPDRGDRTERTEPRGSRPTGGSGKPAAGREEHRRRGPETERRGPPRARPGARRREGPDHSPRVRVDAARQAGQGHEGERDGGRRGRQPADVAAHPAGPGRVRTGQRHRRDAPAAPEAAGSREQAPQPRGRGETDRRRREGGAPRAEELGPGGQDHQRTVNPFRGQRRRHPGHRAPARVARAAAQGGRVRSDRNIGVGRQDAAHLAAHRERSTAPSDGGGGIADVGQGHRLEEPENAEPGRMAAGCRPRCSPR